MAYGIMACAVCTTPVGMIANPFDPTVTTYLDARALNQPGTSPVYAGPGAYSGHAVSAVPEEIRRGWNWAAALNSTLWAFTHRAAGWGLLCAGGLFCWIVAIIAMSSTSSAEMRSNGKDPANEVVGMIFVGGFLLFWIFKTLYLGAKGNTIAWNSGRYSNVSQMRNAQRQWSPWSIVVFCIASAVLFAATIIAANH